MNEPNPPELPGPYDPPPGQRPPYGQQPPAGQEQFDAPPPPYGQQPVQPDGTYPPPPPSGPPPKRKNVLRRVLIGGGVIVALVIIVVVTLNIINPKNPAKANAGDCIKVKSVTDSKADVEKIDCNDKSAGFKVAKKLANDTDDCPSPDYPKYQQSGGRGSSDFALCLMLNAKEGDCFAEYDSPDKRVRVDCGSAEVKVTKVVEGKVDEAACDEQSIPITYPEPATTFCLAQP